MRLLLQQKLNCLLRCGLMKFDCAWDLIFPSSAAAVIQTEKAQLEVFMKIAVKVSVGIHKRMFCVL